jgi:hypothetical protein
MIQRLPSAKRPTSSSPKSKIQNPHSSIVNPSSSPKLSSLPRSSLGEGGSCVLFRFSPFAHHRFQNPLRQNHLHIRALVDFLGIPEDRFHSIVFFIGETEFKTEMPDNVLNRGLIPWITKHTTPLLSPDVWQTAAERLAELDRTTDRKAAAKAHVADLKTRFAN